MIFESHAHYDDEAFESDRDQLLSSLAEYNIGYVINVAASLNSVKTTQNLMKKWSDMLWGVGRTSIGNRRTEQTKFYLAERADADTENSSRG